MTDDCNYPECGCDFDAVCDTGLSQMEAAPQKQASGELREQIARVVDPDAWSFYDRHRDVPAMRVEIAFEVRPSRDKADAILSLPALSALTDKVKRLEEALEVAAGRLYWAAHANPGCSSPGGQELVARWAEEARAALSESGND